MELFDAFEIPPIAPRTAALPSALSAAGKVCGAMPGIPFTINERSLPFIHQDGATSAKNVFDRSASARGINDFGDIVGAFLEVLAIDGLRPYFWLDGEPGPVNMLPLMPPGAIDGVAFGINGSREIVGSYELHTLMGLQPHPFLYRPATGELIELMPPGWSAGHAKGINDLHQVVGNNSGPGAPGFFYDMASNSFTELSFTPFAIGPTGLIVGNADDGTPILRSGGTDVPLPTFGGEVFRPSSVDGIGRVVGGASTDAGESGPFYFDGVELAMLNDLLLGVPELRLTAALDINDAGWIVAQGKYDDDPSAQTRGFILKPNRNRLPRLPRLPELSMKIIGGVIFGGSGFGIVNGQIVRIPSNNPEDVRRVWQSLSAAQRDAIYGLVLDDLASSLSQRKQKEALKTLASRIVIEAGEALAKTAAPEQRAAIRANVRDEVSKTESESFDLVSALERFSQGADFRGKRGPGR